MKLATAPGYLHPALHLHRGRGRLLPGPQAVSATLRGALGGQGSRI